MPVDCFACFALSEGFSLLCFALPSFADGFEPNFILFFFFVFLRSTLLFSGSNSLKSAEMTFSVSI